MSIESNRFAIRESAFDSPHEQAPWLETLTQAFGEDANPILSASGEPAAKLPAASFSADGSILFPATSPYDTNDTEEIDVYGGDDPTVEIPVIKP